MADQFEFAEAFLALKVRGADEFRRIIKSGTVDLQKLQRSMEGVARHARRMLLVGGAALLGFTKLASDAEETASKFNAVFKQGADDARAWADALAKAVGRSSLAIQEGLSSFQSFFIGLGFGADAAVEMSKRMQRLSIDFASFNNISDDEAVRRFISALSGSSEVLDIYGINIKAAALETQLLDMGITASASSATEMEKSIARIAIISKAMGQQGAIGDAVRTSGSLANQFKATTAEAQALAVEIGTAFIPVMQRAIKVIRGWTDGLRDLATGNEDGIVSVTLFVGALLTVVAVAPKVVAAIIAIGGAMKLLAGGALAGGLLGVLVLGVAALGAAWVSASVQGKGFAETVLEIAGAVGVLDAAERKRTGERSAKRTVAALKERGGKRFAPIEDVLSEEEQAAVDRTIEALKRRGGKAFGPREAPSDDARIRRQAKDIADAKQQEIRVEEAAVEKLNRKRETDEEAFGRKQEEAAQRLADIAQADRERTANENLAGAKLNQEETERAERLNRRRPGQIATASVANLQGLVQNLLNQPPRPEDVERNKLLDQLNQGQGDVVNAVKAIPGNVFQ